MQTADDFFKRTEKGEQMMENPLNFAEKKFLVTGASSGIGKETAIYLSRLGARLVITGRNEEHLKQTYQCLDGNYHKMILGDLAEMEDMDNLFQEAVSDGIKLTGMVHSAGIAPVLPLRLLTKKKIDECMGINFYAFIELVRQYSKKKYNNGGSIVGISAIYAVAGAKCQSIYSASKAAMNASVTSLALELAKKNIRINTVMPGAVKTDIGDAVTKSMENEAYTENLLKRQVLGLEEPEDIAAVCAFLLSDMSKVITGRAIYADGGMLG